jgi:CTP:molybdopterin cytidylyltransferase MocA
MEAFKPLLPLCGKPIIVNTVASLFSGGASHVAVVVGYRASEVASVLAPAFGSRVSLVYNPDYASTDMLRSVKLGLAAVAGADAFYILPGDMPVVAPSTFRLVAEKFRETGASVAFPVLDGYRKHPPLVSSSVAPAIAAYGGPGGLRGLWRSLEDEITCVDVSDPGVWVDLDTQSDYKKCKQAYEAAYERM